MNNPIRRGLDELIYNVTRHGYFLAIGGMLLSGGLATALKEHDFSLSFNLVAGAEILACIVAVGLYKTYRKLSALRAQSDVS